VLCEYCEREINDDAIFCQFCGHTIVEWKLDPGQTLHHGRYKVKKALGSGGMASVYLAEDLNLDKTPCVLKVMSDKFTSAKERKYAIDKFKEEAVMLARLRHTNLPVVQNHFSEDGRYYLVMDYVQGETLEDILNSTLEDECLLSEDLVLEWIMQVCDVLHYLHTRKPMIIHRDVKTDNLMEQADDGRIMLLDFGVASMPTKKETGTLVGTPGYASPEQYLGKAYPQSDVFAMGVTLHRLLTGFDPSEEDEDELEDPTSLFTYPPLNEFREDLSPGLQDIITKSTQLEVENRFSSAKEFKEALIKLKEKPRQKFPGSLSGKGRGIIKEKDRIILQRKKVGLQGVKSISPAKAPPTDLSETLKIKTDMSIPLLKDNLSRLAALEIGTYEIKLLVIDVDGNGNLFPKIIAADRTPDKTVSSGLILEPDKLSRKLGSLMEELKGFEIITSIPSYCCSVRTLKVPATSEEKLPSIFATDLQKVMPLPVDRCYINYEIVTPSIPGDEKNMRIRITATVKDAFLNLQKTLKMSGILCNKVALEPFVLANLAGLMIRDEEKKKDVLIINIGSEGTSIAVIKDGLFTQTAAFTHGGKNLTQALMQAERLNYEDAENLKKTECSADLTSATGKSASLFQVLLPHFKDWTTEMIKSLRFFGPEYSLNKFKSVIFCGGGIQLKNLHKHLGSQLKSKSDKFFLPKSKEAKINMEVLQNKEVALMTCMGLAISPYTGIEYLKPRASVKIKKKKGFFDSLFGRT